MKCPSCYADYSSEEPRCPYCGAENPRYRKKIRREKAWETQYQQKKERVVAASRLLIVKRVFNGLILGCVLIFLACLAVSVYFEMREDTRREEGQEAYVERLEQWYQDGQYTRCYALLLEETLYGSAYDKYEEAGELAYWLGAYRRDLEDLRYWLRREAEDPKAVVLEPEAGEAVAGTGTEAGEEPDLVDSNLTSLLRSANMVLEQYERLDSQDPAFLAFAEEAAAEVGTGLQLYLGMDSEAVEALRQAEYSEDYEALTPAVRKVVEENGAE